MKLSSILLSITLALPVAACGGGATSSTTPRAADDPNSCEKAAANLTEKFIAATGANQTPEQTATFKANLAEGCAQDGWSAEVRACFANLQDGQNPDMVCPKLTPLQERSMRRRMQASFGGDKGPGDGAVPDPGDGPAE